MRTRSKCSSTNSATSRAKCSAGKRSFSAGATDNRRSGRTHGTSCSAGNFGLAELGVCALSKTYLEQLVIGGLISRPSFRATTLNPITPPGVLPTQAGTQLRFLSALDERSSCLALLPLPARTSRHRPALGLLQGHRPKPDRLSADVSRPAERITGPAHRYRNAPRSLCCRPTPAAGGLLVGPTRNAEAVVKWRNAPAPLRTRARTPSRQPLISSARHDPARQASTAATDFVPASRPVPRAARGSAPRRDLRRRDRHPDVAR